MKIWVLNNNSILQKEFVSWLNLRQLNYEFICSYNELQRPESAKEVIIGLYNGFPYDKEIETTRRCIELGYIYLSAHVLMNEIYIGPIYYPGGPCISCLVDRLSLNNPEHPLLYLRNKELSSNIAINIQVIHFACLRIMDDLEAIEKNQEPSSELIHIKQNPFRVYFHHVHKSEPCSICNRLPEDSQSQAAVKIQAGKKISPKEHRIKEIANAATIRKHLVDKDTGVYKHIYNEVESRYIPMLGMECFEKKNTIHLAFGRSYNLESAEKSTLLEGLERYSNMSNRKSRTSVFGSYNQLKEKAIHPSKFGLHSKEQLKQKGFDFTEYTDDLAFHWVWGWSMKHNKAVLVPEQMIFFGIEFGKESEKRFIYETSNGCALGGTRDEAMLYGIFEMIERDNFLVSWYNKLELKEIDVEKSRIDDISQIVRHMEEEGYALHFFDMSMELKIPSIMALMINKEEECVVKTYCAAGAHFNPESALRSALIEVVTSVPVYEKVFNNETMKSRMELMYDHDEEATEFEDHVLLYSHRKAVERYDYLLKNNHPILSLQEIYPEWYQDMQYQNEYLRDDIQSLLNGIYDHYEDVYAVDLTGELLDKLDLSCVKVLIPGMLTMSFGHQYRRIIEERVLNGPVLSGRRKEPIHMGEINTLPHPFP